MRKLVVAFSAVAMVVLGASAAQAQTQKCAKPETIKFEAPFQAGQTIGGITLTAGSSNSASFVIGDQVTITKICVKAGTNATNFMNFSGTTATIGGITVSWTCPVFNGNIVGDGTCTVTVTRNSGPGLSHITFYTTAYVAPEAAVSPLVAAQGAGAVGTASAGGLAFTGAQISIMLVILAGLIAVGTLAWTAGRRRAAKAE